jgi:hypothetical protein
MNTLDQEKAIAEACGVKPELVEWWAYRPDDTGGRICMSSPTKERVEEWIKDNPVYAEGYAPKAFYRYPNYTRDLNAMISAFGKLGRHWEIRQVGDGYVCRIQFGPKNKDVVAAGLELLPVMSEAFLRAIGRWIETPATNKEENAKCAGTDASAPRS